MCLKLALTLLSFLILVDSYNILGIFPHSGKSHMVAFSPLMQGLAEKGHNVTVISYFPLEKSFPNYNDVDLNDKIPEETFTINMTNVHLSKWTQIGIPFLLIKLAEKNCVKGLNSEGVRNFLHTKPKIDVIIVEMFNSDCFLSFSDKLSAPVVGVSSSPIFYWYQNRFGNPSHTGYIPNNLLTYSDRMTFFERVGNTLVSLVHQFVYDFIIVRTDERIVSESFGENTLPLSRISQNMSLMLVNTHFTNNFPKPLVPNIIEVGGIHIGKKKPLPKVCRT